MTYDTGSRVKFHNLQYFNTVKSNGIENFEILMRDLPDMRIE